MNPEYAKRQGLEVGKLVEVLSVTNPSREWGQAAGIHANAAMWVDPALKNTCMVDPVGGSVSFYDTYVKLVRVS